MRDDEGIDFKQLWLSYRKSCIEFTKLSLEFKKNYVAKLNSYKVDKYDTYRRTCREIKIKILTHKFFIEHCARGDITDDSFIQIVELLLKHTPIDVAEYCYQPFLKRVINWFKNRFNTTRDASS